MRNRVASTCTRLTTILLVSIALAWSQVSPGDHAAHHPGSAAPAPKPMQGVPSSPGAVPSGSTAGAPSPAGNAPQPAGMGAGMGEMMREMGRSPQKELYPSLMEFPELTPEERAQMEQLAHERMKSGAALMSSGLEQLSGSTANEDYAKMQDATAQLRQGLSVFESGLAAHRSLAEGKAPRNVALQWFKRNMNLLPLGDIKTPHGVFGLSIFHYFIMFILVAFAATMVWMYFHKMHRAEALVARLAGAARGPARSADQVIEPPETAGSSSAALVVQPTEGVPPVNPEIAPSKPNSWTGLLRVSRIFQETPNVKTFRLTDLAGGKLPFSYLPGQFLTVTVTPNGDSIKRSYTIASSPTRRDFCEITVKREEHGIVSCFLHDRVHEGDTLQITAPSGRFTFTGEEAAGIVLIAGGVGVTPMMSVLRYLTDRSWPGDIFFLYACRTEKDIIFREELEYLVRRYPNLHLTITADPIDPAKWPYATGRINREVLSRAVPHIETRRVHICGPPPMMDAVKTLLTELGVPTEQIKTEIFIGKERPQIPAAAIPSSETKVAVVTFARSRRTAMLPPNKTILEASEDAGVNIDYSCRVGTCGTCRVKLLAGRVTQEVQDGLEPGDKEKNIILACQAKSTDDLSVDA